MATLTPEQETEYTKFCMGCDIMDVPRPSRGMWVDLLEYAQTSEVTHSEMVAGLVKDGGIIAAEMTPSNAHVLHMAIGISGEAGEMLDAIKKGVIYQKPFDMENIVEELGDLEFYLEGLRQGFGITREETLVANIAKLGKRYEGHKYSDKQAHDRADKAGE